MNLLTIFTPTYNRAHLLQRVYDSLLAQTVKDFEWVIVDDGSSDNTPELIQQFADEQRIKIVFEKQINSGKHIAVNRGLQLASGELFLILDSDDELTPDAVIKVTTQWSNLQKVTDFETFGGLVANKSYTNGKEIGSGTSYEILDTTIIDYRFHRKIKGDKLEIFKTQLIKQYPFPVNGEKFCPEALIWNRIGSKYKFRFFNDSIYFAEYLPHGLSDRIVTLRKKNPNNAAVYYAELAAYHIPFAEKIKAGINYWRFCIYDKSTSVLKKLITINPLIGLVTLPFGLVMALRDIKNNSKLSGK
ncbi:MAG: glycosyltransferase family 2 protein [Taibaiella sp.]|jgi:glycosyltransferase involved in cell wall biosynthesis